MAGKAPSRFKSGKAHLSKPYEKPKSILHKVASTVKDLLLPSWLTASAWTAGPENEEDEQEDGPRLPEREDEARRENVSNCAEEDSDVTQFASRDGEARFGAPHDGFDCSFAQREMPPRLPSASTPVPLSASRAVDGPALMNGDSHSENSEASGSTSGCSSLVPSLRQRDGASSSAARDVVGLSISEAALERLRHDLTSRRDFGVTADLPLPEPSRRDRRESQLWSEESIVANGSLRHPQSTAPGKRRPSFSLSTFGTPVTNDGIKSREDGRFGSPFYAGRTTYGGAAAYRRFGLVGARGPFETEPKQVSVPCKRAKVEEDATHMSTTTRRILQSLEKVATPLSEAKKVPLDRGPPDPILSFTPASQRRRLALGQKPQAAPAMRGPPSTSFARPIPVRLERNLGAVLTPKPSSSPRELTATRMSTPGVVISASKDKVPALYSTESTRLQDDSGGGKMRAKVVQHQRPSLRHRRTEEEEMVQVPDLPNVALPITTLPSFRPPPEPVPSSNPPAAKASSANTVKTTESKSTGGLEFQFSAPVYQEKKDVSTPTTAPAQEFSFSKPTLLTPEAKDAGRQITPSAPPAKRKAASPATSHSTDAEGLGSPKAASQLILGGSVMDVLGKSSSAEKLENGTGSNKNGDRSSKSSEPADAATETSAASSSSQALWEKFKPAVGSWSCPICMISNTASAAKCAACETPKPSSSSTAAQSGAAGTTPLAAPASSATSGAGTNGPGFGSLFKPSASSWECDTCLVRNKGDATKCIACEMPKPGAVVKSLPKTEFSFKFGAPPASAPTTTSEDAAPSSGFKFGVSSSAPASASSTGFKFGVPTSTSEQSSSPGFKFGTPATSVASSSSTGFRFGIPTSTPEQDSTPGFKFGVPSTAGAASNAPAFKFGIPEKNEASESKTVVCAESSKDSSVKTSNAAAAKSSDKTDLTFKFGADSKNDQKDSKASGETTAEKSAVASPFAFGGNVTTSPAIAVTPKPKDVTPAAPVSGFSFQAAPKSTESSGGFSFPVASGTVGTPTKGFAFGAPDEKSAKESVTKSLAEKGNGTSEKGGFSFVTAAKKPAEGATVVDGFAFENQAKKREEPKMSGFSLTGSVSDKGAFSFGAPKPTGTSDNKGGFSFGAPGANSPAGGEAPKSGFTFGVPATEKAAEGSGEKVQQGSVFGAPAPAKAPTFAFGGQQTNKAVGTTGPKFVFGQKSEASPGTFTFGAATAPAVTTTQSSTPLFSFKPSVPAAAVPSQPAFGAKQDTPQASPFTFGGTAVSSAVAAPPAVFSFGAPKSEPTPAAPQQSAPVFSFGASAHSQAPAAGAAAPSTSQPVFSFGASQAPSSAPASQVFSFGANSLNSTPFGNTTPAAQAGTVAPPAGTNSFSFPAAASPFGASQSQGAATASPFGASQPQPAAAAPFGASQTSQGAPNMFGAGAPQPPTASASGFAFRPPAPTASPAFQFGSSAPGSQEVFRFGAQTQSQEPQVQQPGTFNFNSPVAGAAPAFGQQAVPGFNFVATGASPAGFQFQAGADGNPFSATGTGVAPGRRIRKAVRRKPPNQR